MLETIFLEYIKKSRGLAIPKNNKSYLNQRKIYLDSLQKFKFNTPGCIDERPRINLSSFTPNLTQDNIIHLVSESKDIGLSLRPTMAGGSAIFILAILTLTGYVKEDIFEKMIKITDKLNWKVKAHIDNHSGDSGCGFAKNLKVILLNTLNTLSKSNTNNTNLISSEELSLINFDANKLISKIRDLPLEKQEIILTIGEHKSAQANALFIIDKKGETILREEFYNLNPTFPISMGELADEDIYNVYKEVLGNNFSITYIQFVKLFIEIHLSTLELLGVLDNKRDNIYII